MNYLISKLTRLLILASLILGFSEKVWAIDCVNLGLTDENRMKWLENILEDSPDSNINSLLKPITAKEKKK